MNAAITVDKLSKRYYLGAINRHTLADELDYWRHRLRGRDPQDHLGKVNRRKVARERQNEEFWALKDISFEVPVGEAVGIIGPNGAGKSTLLKVLTRITEPTRGSAVIEGRIGALLEVGTGFHPELTGRENVYMNGAVLGMKRWEIDAKFDEIAQFSGVEQFLDTPVKRYSSGMYVRLAFSVAAHLEPEILIVDEVLSVGDADFRKKCLVKMMAVAKDGRTILVTSHMLSVIRTLCPRTIWLSSGEVAEDGPTVDVLHRYMNRHSEDVDTPSAPPEVQAVSHDGLLAAQAVVAEFRGKDLVVRMQLAAAEALADVGVGFEIQDERKARVARQEPFVSGAFLRDVRGATEAELVFPGLWSRLNGGAYNLRLWFVVQGVEKSLDLGTAATFAIDKTDPQEAGVGLIDAKHGPLYLAPVLKRAGA